VCTFAKQPGADARLAPCRYHLFVRGLNGAYVALARNAGRVVPQLFLEPVRETPDGARTLELRACRRCGQPYLFGHKVGPTLQGFAGPEADPGDPLWLTYEQPRARSEDEDDEEPEGPEDKGKK